MKRFLFLLLALPFLLQQYPLVAQTVRGIVFHDKNGNKQQDRGEPGIPGVAVSDQVGVVLTDAEGRFQLEATDLFNTIFISLPDGYQGDFWQVRAPELSFPLRQDQAPQSFRFIHASDTHVDSLNLPRMARFRQMADSIGAAFVIVSGDLIRDALRVTEPVARAYYEMYLGEIGKFSMPVFSGMGNHELFGIERDKSLVSEKHPLYGKNMYRHYLGPDYYSFNFGGLHFVSVDAMQYKNLYYYGGIDSLQLAWLEKDLAVIPKDMPVITFNHIPLVSPGFSFQDFENDDFYGPSLLNINGKLQHRHIVSNFADLKKVIGGRPYPLALSGHYHAAQEGYFVGAEPRFAQTSAITRPDRFDFNGFPVRSGFTVYEVSGGKVVKSWFVPLNLKQ